MGQDYELFVRNVKKKTGLDLSLYKETQMKRRLKSFYEKKGFRSFSDLYCGLSKDAKLLEEFLDRITINVSEFFRNRKHWEILETSILPPLLQKNRRIRVWSAACSTGEEPYTLALILSKFMPLSQIKIIATDIDEKALSKAKEGLFSERAVQEIPSELKRKYFSKKGDLYILSDDIKKTVIFKKHNLLADPYGGPYDLIVCRNVLIYFTEEAKEMVYKKFNKALTTGGILFVGSTEQIFNPSRYGFAGVETFFYKKTGQ